MISANKPYHHHHIYIYIYIYIYCNMICHIAGMLLFV